jgi:hypothetical protein
MSGLKEVEPNITDFNSNSPYYKFFTEQDPEKNMQVGENPDNSHDYLFDDEDTTKNISLNSFDDSEETTVNTLVIDFKYKSFNIKASPINSLSVWLGQKNEEAIRVVGERDREGGSKRRRTIKATPVPPVPPVSPEAQNSLDASQASKATTALGSQDSPRSPGSPGSPSSPSGGGNYLARGGAPFVRRISASISDAQARQTRESAPPYNFDLHRSFFLIIWEHFAPNLNIRERPRRYDRTPLNVRLPPMYISGNRVCSILLRCVTRNDAVRRITNIVYSVLFEFTNHIHWSIFYSFNVDNSGAPIVSSGQVSELHFTLNPYGAIPKTRMFFAYTDYINGLIRPVHHGMAARPRGGLHLVSSKEDQVPIMGIVSKLMLLTMYQLITAKSYTTNEVFPVVALIMRQNIDSVGDLLPENQLLNIALQHVDLIDCIQQEFGRHSLSLPSEDFINYLKTDIQTAIRSASGLAGGKNINRYLTKINNIKEKLKLLKKNKVKNKVKITKLSKLIEELKAKLKKQKEKDKAKLKKQKEKEKAKLKKQKEKEKAKLKKQKEKDNVKRKKTKAKKS